MSGPKPDLKIVNNTATRVLFSDFNAGDNGAPVDATWVEAHGSGKLKVGSYSSLSIGVQAQEGGRWIGGDPADPPYAVPGNTVTLEITKKFS